MQPPTYVGSHKGHRLVERPSPRGDKVYRVPEQLAARPISECIRSLAAEGWSRAEISNVTGILYQHVRNVLEDRKGGTGGMSTQRSDEEMLPDKAVEEGRVGSMVAFADLIERVEHSREEITVTRDGAPVARIVPLDHAPDDEVSAALARMDERRKRLSLRGLSVKELINEGRP